jgi:hypothetical protein
LRFDATRLKLACEVVLDPAQSRACGDAIGQALTVSTSTAARWWRASQRRPARACR